MYLRNLDFFVIFIPYSEELGLRYCFPGLVIYLTVNLEEVGLRKVGRQINNVSVGGKIAMAGNICSQPIF